jgi:hypothetical protein
MGGIAIPQEKTAGRVNWGGDDERELLSRHEVVRDAYSTAPKAMRVILSGVM